MPKRSLAVVLTLAAAVFSAHAGLFNPLRPLSEISTPHFDFIFPDDLRAEAEYLASQAEDMLADVAAELEFYGNLRMPVILTPDAEIMNGGTYLVPYTEIIIYVAPPGLGDESGGLKEALKTVFLHELTHAVSLNIRGPFWNAMSAIFNTSLTRNILWSMPPSFIEGVTVSFESRDGYGRVNDPYVREVLRQDAFEGRFKTFEQCAGTWDAYAGGSPYYFYGGLFSAYLQAEYGSSAYAELWREVGQGNPLLDFRAFFRKVYKVTIDSAWVDFRKTMEITVPVVAAVEGPDIPQGRFTALASHGDTLYYVDLSRHAAFSFSVNEGRENFLFEADGGIAALAVSADGTRLLVSGIRYRDSFPRLFVRTFDLAAGNFLPGGLEKIREASFFRDGIIGIEASGFTTDLVFENASGRTTVIKGREGLEFGSPVALDDDSIAFIMNDLGERSVAKFSFGEGSCSILDCAFPLRYVRGLSVSDGSLLFAVNGDDTLYRLARVKDGRVFVQEAPLSGGVFDPVGSSGEVFYRGRFSTCERILKFPEGNPALALGDRGPAVWLPYSSLPAETDPTASGDASQYEGKAYSPFPYILSTIRTPLLELKPGLKGVAAAGLELVGLDPVRGFYYTAAAAYDLENEFLETRTSVLSDSLPVAIGVSESDTMDAVGRSTAFGFDLSYAFRALPVQYAFTIGTNASIVWRASRSAPTPAAWTYASPYVSAGATLAVSRFTSDPLVPSSREGFGLALSGGLTWSGERKLPAGSTSLTGTLSLPVVPLSLTMVGVLAASPVLSAGGGTQGTGYSVYGELAALFEGKTYDRLMAGEAKLTLAVFEIQRGVPWLGIYLNRAFANSGYRFIVVPGGFGHSAFFRINLTFCPMLGYLTSPFNFFVETYYLLLTGKAGFSANVEIPL